MRAYAACIGVTLECRRMESEMVGGVQTRVDEAYHDITPLLCRYVSERRSASLSSGAAGCSWGGSSRGVWGIGVLEVEVLCNGVGRKII